MDQFEALEMLFDEVRRGMHRLVQVTEAIHGGGDTTLGMRAILEYLHRNGDVTVPQIARDRHVTRQHIQMLVNALLDRELVRLVDNPAHRRSALVSLTSAGRKQIRSMRAKERRAFEAMGIEVSERQLREATRTLRIVRESLSEG